MAKYTLSDDYSLALSYIQNILTKNFKEAELIESTNPEALNRGLLLTSTTLVEALGNIWQTNTEETIKRLRNINQE